MTGKVWLVGAGPGDRGLLTLKGLEVLREAEVVVYDALVGDEVLTLIPENAKKINAGKRAGRHLMAQEEISRLLLEEAQKGFRVVRLKGGDPFVFGRGGEELELLSQAGIPFEVVPGVTSAFAVPAYNGIPVTHRDYTSSVHIITGHRRKKQEQASLFLHRNIADTAENTCTENSSADRDSASSATGIDFEALVRLNGTLIFLMALSSLSSIMEGLLSAGMDPGMPAAVLEKGTTSKQRRILATVSTLAEEAARARAEAPSIIVVGDVCCLAERFSWYDRLADRPLAGKKILVTRPREMAAQTADRLRRLGAEVLELPAIETLPVSPNPALDACLANWVDPFPDSWKNAFPDEDENSCDRKQVNSVRDQVNSVRNRIRDFGSPDWLVFTSPTGVRVFMDAFLDRYDVRNLLHTKIAVIGEGSREALFRYGLRASFMPSVYDGETLGRELAQRIREDRKRHAPSSCESEMIAAPIAAPLIDPFVDPDVRAFPQETLKDKEEGPVRILIPRAAKGGRELVEELEKAGDVRIIDLPTYDTVYARSGIVDIRAQIRDGQVDQVIFTSASTVRGFCSVMGEKTDLSGISAVCIGRQTAAAAEAVGMQTKTARTATLEALIEAVVTAAVTARDGLKPDVTVN